MAERFKINKRFLAFLIVWPFSSAVIFGCIMAVPVVWAFLTWRLPPFAADLALVFLRISVIAGALIATAFAFSDEAGRI